MGRRQPGPDHGSSAHAPFRTYDKLAGDTQQRSDIALGCNPRLYCDRFEDFDGEQATYTVETPLFDDTTAVDANIISVATGSVAKATVVVPRSGTLLSVSLIAEDALAANDTNFITALLTNKLASGAGAIAMLAATDANTTKATGGTGITAVTGRTFTVNATARNLAVAEGDLLEFRTTVSGTLANVVDNPRVKLVFSSAPPGTYPLVSRIAGVPLSGVVASTAHGEWAGSLEATNEAQFVGITFKDQLIVPAAAGPIFKARVKVGAVTTAQAVVIGFASAFNATLSSITLNAWFRLAASLVLTAETDDNTTDTDGALGTGLTLNANTYYVFSVDLGDPANIQFFVDDSNFATLSAPAFATVSPNLLQPIIGIQKASGTGVVGVTCDWYRCFWPRLG